MQNWMLKKCCVFGIIVLFIGMSVTQSTGTVVVEKSSTVSFDGNTLYVGGSGPGNYSKIQYAIDNASDGDTVFVYDDSSPYYKNIVVDKSINLIGEGDYLTVIDGNKNSGVCLIFGGGSTFTMNKVQKNNEYGIYLEAGWENNVSYNTFRRKYCNSHALFNIGYIIKFSDNIRAVY